MKLVSTWGFAFALISAAAAACGDNLDGGDDDAQPPASCLPGCAGSASRDYDAISYDLHARFDWASQTLTASEEVVLDTTASGPLVQLDSAVDVRSVHAGTQPLAYLQDRSANTLVVDLTPLAVGASFTIDYTAGVLQPGAPEATGALIATTSTPDDPVQSRVVYTDSEPDRALYWLPVKLDPADRALWSVAVTVDPEEDVIANGTRVSDAIANGQRVVAYALDKPIPAYLMAFAAGELEHTDRPTGSSVPLSVWYRKGLVVDPNLVLDKVASAMGVFESLVGAYPWDTYSVVLLPYGGGMENATITFETEGAYFAVTAHELAHHWFGDWVTMHGFDDVWVKEGMATVLESEAERGWRDREGRGRLWGMDYLFYPDDAIVDDSLHGLDKYTSGPYERAGWMISQIRAKIGDEAFFAGLKQLLADHALGSATGEQFLREFQPALDEATVQQLLAALTRKPTPVLTVGVADAGSGATTMSLALSDPGGTMIVPLDFAVIDATGSATSSTLVPGGSLMLTVPAGGYLGADERDLHASYLDFGVSPPSYTSMGARFAPAADAPGALAAFESRSAAQQEKASRVGLLPVVAPAGLAAYVTALDSSVARRFALITACTKATTDPAWAIAVDSLLETLPLDGFDLGYRGCGSPALIARFETELVAAMADGSPAALARAEALLSFDYGADERAVVGPIAMDAPTLLLREAAAQALGTHSSPAPDAARSRVKRTHLRAAR